MNSSNNSENAIQISDISAKFHQWNLTGNESEFEVPKNQLEFFRYRMKCMKQDAEIAKNVELLNLFCQAFHIDLGEMLKNLNALRIFFDKSEDMNLIDFFGLCSQALKDDEKKKNDALELRQACIDLPEEQSAEE